MEIARHWRLRTQRYALVGEVCPHCEVKIFPPRDVCPDCGQEARQPYAFSGRGEVYSFAPVREAPAGYEENAPYPVALIRLEEVPMVTAQLTKVGEVPPLVRWEFRGGMRGKDRKAERGMLVY